MPTGLQNGKYFTPEEIEQEWIIYVQRCNNRLVETASAGKAVKVHSPELPTIEGFCTSIGIDRATLHNYEKAQGYEAYFNIVKRIKEEAKDFKIHALQNGIGNTTGLIFYLKAKEGWQDKQQLEVSGTWKVDFGGTEINTIHPAPEASGNTSIA